MKDLIDIHFEHNCFLTFKPLSGLRGGVLSIPENVIDYKNPVQVIYETENKKVTIYVNGDKEKVVETPNYAIRDLILADIICKCDCSGFSAILVRGIDESGENIEYEYSETINRNNNVNLMNIVMSKKDSVLEKKMNQLFSDLIENKDIEIDDDILSGYEVVRKHYLEEFGKDGL